VSTPIRALVVDDEPVARRTLRRLVEREDGIECVGEAWGPEAVDAVTEQAPDVLFLDVQMPGMSGFEVLERLGDEVLPLVVFVTAFDEYAVRAFEVRAIDYLVKPFTDERFRDVVDRVRDRLTRRGSLEWRRRVARAAASAATTAAEGTDDVDGVVEPEATRSPGRLVIGGSGHSLVVRHTDIDWLEAVGSYVRVHAGDLHKLVRTSLTELEEMLDATSFHRIHRSSIVNLDRVREIESIGHGDAAIRLDDGTELRVSRTRREGFEAALQTT